jgi:hypothetical protein
MGYCEKSDVFRWFPRGSVTNPARLVSAVSTTAETLTVDGHGLSADDEVTFRAESGGSLPSPLVLGTTYYAIPVTESTFQVATAAGGAAVNLTSAGSNVLMISDLPWASWIESATSEIECTLPAHALPIAAPYPAVLTRYTAGIVAEMAMVFCGVSSESIQVQLDRVREELAMWRKGIAIRGSANPTSGQVPYLYTGTTTEATRTIP